MKKHYDKFRGCIWLHTQATKGPKGNYGRQNLVSQDN